MLDTITRRKKCAVKHGLHLHSYPYSIAKCLSRRGGGEVRGDEYEKGPFLYTKKDNIKNSDNHQRNTPTPKRAMFITQGVADWPKLLQIVCSFFLIYSANVHPTLLAAFRCLIRVILTIDYRVCLMFLNSPIHQVPCSPLKTPSDPLSRCMRKNAKYCINSVRLYAIYVI